MKKYFCDICEEPLEISEVFYPEFFKVKYELCEEHYKKMYHYYNSLMERTKNEFLIKFPKINN